jgi:ABC-type cobalamin/Fe3+-siderophores transport system ATPase subunit
MIEIKNVTKKYGDKTAVDNVSFTVEDGEIFAFIGHNGAGKTTLIKAIVGIHDFNEGDTPVFLISLKAGGTGLNLVGADTVIHYDPWWNLAVQNQATDRAHRIGQTKNVTVYRLILKGTIEEKILELQKTKKDLAESILEGNNQSLMSLSSEELLDLLS